MPRDGTKNLKPVRTKEEAKERGKNGGVASGTARRKKRTMQQAAKLLLNMPLSNQSMEKAMSAMGIDDCEMTNQMAVMVSMWREAIQGSVRAAEFLRSTSGQDPDNVLRRQMFEYQKEKDTGENIELEDLSVTDNEIYNSNATEKDSEEKTDTV